MSFQDNQVPLPQSERTVLPGARAIGLTDPNEEIEVTLRLRPRKPIAELATEVEAMGAIPPRERQYRTREEIAADYGAQPADVATVEDFARTNNLQIVDVQPAERKVVVRGNADGLSKVFGVKLVRYEYDTPQGTETYRGRIGSVQIPVQLQGIVEGVFGLDNRRQARPHFRRPTRPALALDAAGPTSYTPPQIAQLYNFPSGLSGEGQCIGILEFGGGYDPGDLDAYFQGLGLATPEVVAVSVNRAQNRPEPGAESPDVEVALDIEVAGAIAPQAKIAVYFSHFTERGWVDALSAAVHDNVNQPSVISISWGFTEGRLIWTQQAIQAVHEAFQQAAAMGITVCCAAGDDGSNDQANDGHAHVDFPASSPFVLACGGTSLFGSGSTITREVVWNDGPRDQGGAGGGGISDVFSLPDYQKDARVPPSVNPDHRIGRGVPDVAANADGNTGYLIRAHGQVGAVGGTSAAAPLWAALIALINQGLGKTVGYINPLLYAQLAQKGVLHDIVEGSNDPTGHIGGYSAGPGWDACTGWGSPNGQELLNAVT